MPLTRHQREALLRAALEQQVDAPMHVRDAAANTLASLRRRGLAELRAGGEEERRRVYLTPTGEDVARELLVAEQATMGMVEVPVWVLEELLSGHVLVSTECGRRALGALRSVIKRRGGADG